MSRLQSVGRLEETSQVGIHKRYVVRSEAGELLGIFPEGELPAVRELVEDHPGAAVKVEARPDNPCERHPSYEADYCPACGTAPEL